MRWTPERKEQLRTLWTQRVRVATIAETMGTSRGAIYVKAGALGLTRAQRRRPPVDSPNRTIPIARGPRDPSGQRRFKGFEHHNGARIALQPHHPAHRDGATIFGGTVRPAGTMKRLLKSGVNSRKLGGTVDKGKWRGIPIVMLTLEERNTCPRTCLEWATCYGNNMHMAQRISDDGTLVNGLRRELAVLQDLHPGGFLVRLHILGDFYSTDYVAAWRQALADFPALRIFGFTARLPSDPIGAAVLGIIADEPERFAMRVSGGGYDTHCAEVVDRAEDATGILCPAQSDPDRCCASCALCWQSDRTISFLRH